MKKYRIEWSSDCLIGMDKIIEAESVAKAFQIFYDSCPAETPVILDISEWTHEIDEDHLYISKGN